MYATYGNHDYYPHDQFPPHNNELYNRTLEQWKSWINDVQQEDNFRKGEKQKKIIYNDFCILYYFVQQQQLLLPTTTITTTTTTTTTLLLLLLRMNIDIKDARRYTVYVYAFIQKLNFFTGGYYTVKTTSGIRILALNTNLYYTSDKVTAGLTDPADQFSWMENVLASSNASNEKVKYYS